MKIAVIGYSGAGKSTLAKKLSAHYSEPVLHLDAVHFLPGWQERDREEEIRIVAGFLDNNAGWVIDGNYRNVVCERRMLEADMIVVLLLNRFASLKRAYQRYRKYKGKSRDDMTHGCDEKLDFEFIKWILYEGRTKKYTELYRRVISEYPNKTVALKNQREIDEFVRSLDI